MSTPLSERTTTTQHTYSAVTDTLPLKR
jgi:hypothetical protein